MTTPGTRPQLLPPIPPAVRFVLFGLVIGGLVYGMSAFGEAPGKKPIAEVVAPTETVVPSLDRTILALAHDGTREERLLLEAEPLRHLLAKAIDVGPTVAAALGMPEAPVPVATLRSEIASYRGRWLYYEGKLEQLSGPREGHPIRDYGIHEATVRLPDGEAVLAAFSFKPDAAITVGSWVRIEGFLLKLVDTTYPSEIQSAPFLIGRAIQRDYPDWPPVTAIDPELLGKVDDSSYWPGDLMWHTIEEDQTEPLWHLGAYARDSAKQRALADWRRVGTLNGHEQHQKLLDSKIARGTPMRVFGTLIRRKTIAAPANPAGIKFWTEALVQVREYGGTVVPIWVPQRVRELPDHVSLEVRGFYYRWYAFETLTNQRRKAPLFVAADLDVYELEVDRTMQSIGIWLGGGVVLFMLLVWWVQRSSAQSSLQHARDMDARRRRRREQQQAKQQP